MPVQFAIDRLWSRVTPVRMAALGVFLFVVFEAQMKVLVADYPILQATAMRYLSGLGWVALLVLWRPISLTRSAFAANALRAVFLVAAAYTGFFALSLLPLAELYAIGYLEPFIVALTAWVLLGERPGLRTVFGMVLASSGVLVVIWDQLGGSSRDNTLLGLGMSLLASFFYAIAVVIIRARAKHDSVMTIVTIQVMVATLLVVPATIPFWQPVAAADVLRIVVAGATVTAAQLCLVWALTRMAAAKVALVEYTAFIWAILAGWLFFGETPTLDMALGAVIIVSACVVALRPLRTHALGRGSARGTASTGEHE